MKGNTTKMYWERYIDRRNPRRIEPLDKPIDTYIMLDTETTGLHPEEGATLIEIGALFVQPGNENSRPKFEQLIDPQQPLTEFITDLTGHHRPHAPRHADSRRGDDAIPPVDRPGLAGGGAVDHHRAQRPIRCRFP